MALGLTRVFLFLFFIMQTWAQHGPLEVVGAVHGVAYLSPRLQTQTSYHQIHWRRNNSVKIASRDSRGKVWYANSTYKGRLELFPNNTLKISCLQKNDSSMYQVYLEDEVGKEHIENILLTVYELVPKPTVNAKVIRGDSTWCKATLECSVGLEGVAYEWIPPSKLLLEDAGASEQHVSFDPLIETYTCKVSNPVSSNNASLTYRHPCSWTAVEQASGVFPVLPIPSSPLSAGGCSPLSMPTWRGTPAGRVTVPIPEHPLWR
ncbi:CD48 antigen-like isoform 7-T8 [Morphnus guianensis]